MKNIIKRSSFIAKVAGAATIAILAANTNIAQAASKQTTIKVLSFKDGHSLAVKAKLSEFKKQTGIDVKFDLIPSSSVASKTVTDQSGGGIYDAYLVDEPYLPQLSKFFVPVNEWPVKDESVNPSQFVKAAISGSSFAGKQYGMPVNGNVYMYIYRKDLFEDPKEKAAYKKKYGAELKTPTTPKEFFQVSQFFHRPPKMYGFAPFTKKSEGTTVEAVWLFGMLGYDLFDENGNIVLKKDEAKKAFAEYKKLMDFSPSGSKSWHHSERMRAYSKGKIAHMMTWPSFLKDLENKKKSLVVGKTGYAVAPSAKEGESSGVAGTWSMAISKTSKNKEAAAKFAYWWAGFQSGKSLVPQGMNPARKDLLSENVLVGQNPWFPSILANFDRAQVRPRVVGYQEVSHTISKAFTEVVSGQKTPEAASTQLLAELKKVTGKTK